MSESNNFSVPNIIRKKRDKEELDDAEIRYIIDKIIAPSAEERIHDAQIGKNGVYLLVKILHFKTTPN